MAKKKLQSKFKVNKTALQVAAVVGLAIVGFYTVKLLNSKKNVAPTDSSAASSTTCNVKFSVPKECLAYAVQDTGESDSQFFTIDTANNFVSKNLGPLYANYNLESLDIHPTTGELYTVGASGNGSTKNGLLFRVDKTTGGLTQIGQTGQQRIVGLSFRPTDGTLWGWANGTGIVKIDITNAATTVIFRKTGVQLQGAAWSNDGKYLYVSGGSPNAHQLWKYDTTATTPTFTKIATNLPSDITEALEMAPDGTLLGGWHQGPTGRTIFAYNLSTLQPIPSRDILTANADVEGIAWPTSCPLR